MCEYCEKPNKTIVTHITGVSAFVGANRLWLRYYIEKEDRTYSYGSAKIKSNYQRKPNNEKVNL